MPIYMLKLKFKSPVRIGAAGRDEQAARESLPADQLFSWLSLGWIRAFGVEDFELCVARRFLSGNPPWNHSDLFPCSDGQMWLPAPRWTSGDGVGAEKKERTPWVRLEEFFGCLEKGTVLGKQSYGSPVQVNMLNNVRIRRTGERDNAPYYTASVQTSRDVEAARAPDASTVFAGLIFINEKETVDKLRAAVAVMMEDGFGGNRSSGLGTIESFSLEETPDFQKLLKSSPGTRRFVILSPCYPTQKMVDAIKNSELGSNAYTLTSRAGWVYDSSGRATDIRKSTTFLFDSGSSFSVEPEGQLIDVGRRGKVSYRYGIPFVVQA